MRVELKLVGSKRVGEACGNKIIILLKRVFIPYKKTNDIF